MDHVLSKFQYNLINHLGSYKSTNCQNNQFHFLLVIPAENISNLLNQNPIQLTC